MAEATVPRSSEGPSRLASSTARETRHWSIWVSPNLTWSYQDDPISGNDGHTLTIYSGVDRRIGDRGVFGIVGGYERADFDTTFLDGEFESRGVGIGVYGGYALTDAIVVDAMAIYGWRDNDYADSFRSAGFDSTRLQLAANVTGYVWLGQFGIRPKLGIAFTRDSQDAYADTLRLRSPATTVETLSVTAGSEFGYTFFVDDVRTIEPFVGVSGVYEETWTDPDPGGSGDELGAFDLVLSGGVNAQLTEAAALSVKVDLSGLARSDYRSLAFGGQVSLRF